MAMKMINKKDCEYKGGYIVCDGKIVGVDNEIVDLLNKLDTDVQRAEFEKNHIAKPAMPMPEFEPKSEHGCLVPFIQADTPEMDKMAEHSMKIMDELDAVAGAELANEYIAGVGPLLMFVNDEFIVSGEQGTQHRFDLPVVGNPLELDKEKLADLIVGMFE
jgi:hypothetical protein